MVHSRGAYSSAWNYCTLFNNPNSHRTVTHWQCCRLKRVIKLISHMLFQNTVASLCLEMLCSVSEWQFSNTAVKRKQQSRRNIVQRNQTGEYLSNRTKQGSYHNSTRNILLKWWVIVVRTYISPSWCEMVHLSVAKFPGNMVFCLHGSAICAVGLLIGLCALFKTSNNLTVRWPMIACLLVRFADLLVLKRL